MKREKFKKAKTCICCTKVGKLGCAFVTEQCKNNKKIFLKQKNMFALTANHCDKCQYYKKGKLNAKKTQKGSR